MDDKLWSRVLLEAIQDDKLWSRALLEAIQQRSILPRRRSRLYFWVRDIRYRLGMAIIPEDMRCYYD